MRLRQYAARALARGLSSRADQQRLEQLPYRDAGHGYDTFGMHRDWLAAAQALAGPLYRSYFRVSSHGAEHIPTGGPAILVANHAGMLPLDAAMICMDVLVHTSPPRMLRCIGDRFIADLPFVGTFVSRCGVVSGTVANVRRLLDDGELCLIFPEGVPGIGKPFSERYRLHGWRVGHAELAIEHGVPVVPVAVIGSEEQWPQIGRVAKLHPFGAPYLPIPASPLPLPVHYHLHYGPAIALRNASAPPDLRPEAIERAAAETRAALEQLIRAGRAQRRGVFR